MALPVEDIDDALKPNPSEEDAFLVADNKFAYSPGQLNKLFNPKSLAAFYAIGGLAGLEKGLRTDHRTGLSVDETCLDGSVTFEEATGQQLPNRDRVPEETQSRGGTQDIERFADRKRVFRDNRLPEKRSKTLLELMWTTYNDNVLMLLSIVAVVSLAIGDWIESLAVLTAIAIIVVMGALGAWQKERQFAKLEDKKRDRTVRVVRSGKTAEISVYDILVGDVLHIEPGDMVPVDGILIEGFHVKCDESSATGESDLITKKSADGVFAAIQNCESTKRMDPFIISGSRIMEGVGIFMVTSVGVHSSYGRTLMSLREEPWETADDLPHRLNRWAELFAKLGRVAALLVFIVLAIDWLVRTSLPGFTTTDTRIYLSLILGIAAAAGVINAISVLLHLAKLTWRIKACLIAGNIIARSSAKTGTLTQNKRRAAASGDEGHQFDRVRSTTLSRDDGLFLNRSPDIGCSMAVVDTGVGRKASSIKLADHPEGTLVKRFLQFQLTVNSTAVVLALLSTISSWPGNLTPTARQLVWVNLTMDTFAAFAAFALAPDQRDNNRLSRRHAPHVWILISAIGWKMLPSQPIYDLVTTTLTFTIYHFLSTSIPGVPKGIANPLTAWFNMTPQYDYLQAEKYETRPVTCGCVETVVCGCDEWPPWDNYLAFLRNRWGTRLNHRNLAMPQHSHVKGAMRNNRRNCSRETITDGGTHSWWPETPLTALSLKERCKGGEVRVAMFGKHNPRLPWCMRSNFSALGGGPKNLVGG